MTREHQELLRRADEMATALAAAVETLREAIGALVMESRAVAIQDEDIEAAWAARNARVAQHMARLQAQQQDRSESDVRST